MFDAGRVQGPISAEAAALLLSVRVPELGEDDAYEVVLACERMVRAAQAVQAAAIVAACGPAKTDDDPHDPDGEPVDVDAEWLAAGLGGSRQFQLARIDDARFLRRWLPRTWAAMAAGVFGWYEAGLLVRASRGLSRPELAARLEDRVVPRGTFDLARRIRRAVASIDPAGLERKKKQARTGRRLEFFRDRWGDGTASLAGAAESQLIALIAAAVDLDARPKAAGDCRTLDMRRFDVLADWARQRLGLPTEDNHPTREADVSDPAGTAAAARTAAGALLAYAAAQQPDGEDKKVASANGQPEAVASANGQPGAVASADGQPGPVASAASQPDLPDQPPPGSRRLHEAKRCTACGRTGPPRLPLNVTVSLDTLLRLSDQPADLTSWGLLDADTARDLAADATWRRWLCDPQTGHLLDIGATRYVPRNSLAEYVRARDRTCRYPNCNQPAVRCDLDHTEPFDHDHPDHGGPTTRANLCCLCRHHHRLKHQTDAGYTNNPDGTTTWKDPAGRTHTRPAERHHHHDTDWTDWLPPTATPPAARSDPADASDPGEAEPECPF